jgi:hypothetical protein
MILIALVVLSLDAKDGQATPVLISLVGVAGSVAGAIGGFSQQTKQPVPNEKEKEPKI